MYEVNLNSSNDLNQNQKNQANSKYDNMKLAYQGYLQKMDKSDFANSLTRFQIELNLLKDMHNLATEEGKTEEIAYIKEKYDILSDKFKQFGIILKEIDSN